MNEAEEKWAEKEETVRLLDTYGALLTDTQREILGLYFNYDLSLTEIASEKGVSKQSVSDCIAKAKKLLSGYEEKLGFIKIRDGLTAEIEALKNSKE